MKHRRSFPHRMDAPDRHNRQRDKRTNGRTKRRVSASARPSLRWSLTLTYGPGGAWPRLDGATEFRSIRHLLRTDEFHVKAVTTTTEWYPLHRRARWIWQRKMLDWNIQETTVYGTPCIYRPMPAQWCSDHWVWVQMGQKFPRCN